MPCLRLLRFLLLLVVALLVVLLLRRRLVMRLRLGVAITTTAGHAHAALA